MKGFIQVLVMVLLATILVSYASQPANVSNEVGRFIMMDDRTFLLDTKLGDVYIALDGKWEVAVEMPRK